MSVTILKAQRDEVVQTLYIPPFLQTAIPDALIGDEVPREVQRLIEKYDLPRLAESLDFFARGAATRFFNLRSGRLAAKRAYRANHEMISDWLTGEDSVRLAFDYFGEEGEPYVGYGILKQNPSKILFTRILRVVLQRVAGNSHIIWTAYPLLSPRYACWTDIYDFGTHKPATALAPVFYEFLNNYLSVTSDCLMIDSVIQGATDFWQFEPADRLKLLHKTVQSLSSKSLDPADRLHLRYELSVRCLDETLPMLYIEEPTEFVSALQHALAECVKAQPLNRQGAG